MSKPTKFCEALIEAKSIALNRDEVSRDDVRDKENEISILKKLLSEVKGHAVLSRIPFNAEELMIALEITGNPLCKVLTAQKLGRLMRQHSGELGIKQVSKTGNRYHYQTS